MMNHPCPKSVLVIGGGDGGTVREVLKHKTVEKVVLCEIDDMVIEVSKKYLPTIACKLDDPKVEIRVEDAIEYIKDKKNQFDIILIDSTDPMGPGVGLFTEEFYCRRSHLLKIEKLVHRKIRSMAPRMKGEWFEIPMEDLEEVKSIIRIHRIQYEDNEIALKYGLPIF